MDASLQEPAIYNINHWVFVFFSLIWLYPFLLPTILRKLYEAVQLDYSILITIIFLAFLNYMQATFVSLEC